MAMQPCTRQKRSILMKNAFFFERREENAPKKTKGGENHFFYFPSFVIVRFIIIQSVAQALLSSQLAIRQQHV